MLNEQAGENVRNEIAYGIMIEDRRHSGVSLYLICVLVMLLVISSPTHLEMIVSNEKLKLTVNNDGIRKIN